MGIANLARKIARKAVLATGIAATALFSSQNAHADGFKKRIVDEETEIPLPTDSSSPKLRDMFDGYLWAEGLTTPSGSGFMGATSAIFKKENTRIGLHGRYSFFEYDTEGEKNTQVHSENGLISLAQLLRKGNLEFIIGANAGGAADQFRETIEMDAGRFLGGVYFGVANTKNNVSLMLRANGGIGAYDAEFLSGHKLDGPFRTGHVSAELTKQILGEKQPESILDVLNKSSLEQEAANGLYFAASAFVRREEWEEMQKATGYGGRISLPVVLNLSKSDENATRVTLRAIPYAQFEVYNTKGDQASQRETESYRGSAGIRAILEISESFGVIGEFAYEGYKLKTKDVGQGIDSEETKEGPVVKVGVYVRI